MVKFTVLYGHPEDPVAFEEYYFNTHMPIAQKMPNVQRIELGKATSTLDGGDPPYYRIAELWFENADQLQRSFNSREGQETVEDIPNFATGGATSFISEV